MWKSEIIDKMFDNTQDDITDIIIKDDDIKKAIGKRSKLTGGTRGSFGEIFERNKGKHSSPSGTNIKKKHGPM